MQLPQRQNQSQNVTVVLNNPLTDGASKPKPPAKDAKGSSGPKGKSGKPPPPWQPPQSMTEKLFSQLPAQMYPPTNVRYSEGDGDVSMADVSRINEMNEFQNNKDELEADLMEIEREMVDQRKTFEKAGMGDQVEDMDVAIDTVHEKLENLKKATGPVGPDKKKARTGDADVEVKSPLDIVGAVPDLKKKRPQPGSAPAPESKAPKPPKAPAAPKAPKPPKAPKKAAERPPPRRKEDNDVFPADGNDGNDGNDVVPVPIGLAPIRTRVPKAPTASRKRTQREEGAPVPAGLVQPRVRATKRSKASAATAAPAPAPVQQWVPGPLPAWAEPAPRARRPASPPPRLPPRPALFKPAFLHSPNMTLGIFP